MADILTNKQNIIISTGATPTSTEINNQFSAKSIRQQWDSLAKENSGRSDDGVMHIYWVRTKITKLNIELPPCSPTFANGILSKVQGKEYYITYFDLLTDAERTCKVYTSNSQADCYNGVILNGLWHGVSFSAIEV